jgi:hypothetical protein
MQEQGFAGIKEGEGSWWYDGRIFGIHRILTHFNARDERICDVGAGYGAMCPALKQFGHTTAFEPQADVRKHCGENCDAVFPSGNLPELTRSQREKFSLVTLLDVVEHVEDDVGFLRELHKLLPVGGHILVTVPAFMALWSELDVLAMHYRRYNKSQIVGALESAGFEIEYASYWNMMLLLVAFVVRRGSGKGGYAAFSMPRWIDRLFFGWVWLETSLMPSLSLPFGTSVFVYARKKAGS